jgi:hypothetical protein
MSSNAPGPVAPSDQHTGAAHACGGGREERAMAKVTSECDLCGDQSPLVLHARCHLTAPLQATLEGDVLILRCYLPECMREVARFIVTSVEAPHA